MQDVSRLIADGDLDEALRNTQQLIRQNPAEPKSRILLFQLYCLIGQWDKALTQLNVLRDLDKSTLLMVGTYEQVLQCEALRKDVFAGLKTPLIFGEPREWLALLLEALKLENNGNYQQAAQMRVQALEQAPATSGSVDGTPFAWIADADSRLGPCLEAIMNGRYYWIPFMQIGKIQLEPPTDLRDLVWVPAHFTWVNGGEADGLIPTRYSGSDASDDPRIRLSRLTDWQAVADGIVHGLGQRLLATDVDDYALLDLRLIELASE
ncbi:type VI secretion system accessory protein TagJ [Methylomonas sp. UP202]|uniref:type VI secretion system accessory protein TagJ n=1 Tax=unclassified Methylomonas TaxID=2608980 RepID=UPI002478DFB0|nr:type VI secretion system accessory protein TagJ [Methylomonas sp. UP202]WGS86519.1 type VI secretion system accessory protein TagJ [Methylomonas sp. UP202]